MLYSVCTVQFLCALLKHLMKSSHLNFIHISLTVTFEGFWMPLLLKSGIFLIPLSLGWFFGLGFWVWVCFIFLILLIRT